jgi:ribonuclease BN (tRNA processing enzyme)
MDAEAGQSSENESVVTPQIPELPRGPRPAVRVGPYLAMMPNGVFGDPLLHVRLAHRKRSLLIDFGEGRKLPARIAHQVTDVLITHAHADHIGGLLSFIRSRIGDWPVCRIYGPLGIAENVAGMLAGILWDRAGQRAPRFDVTELHGETIRRFDVVAGRREPDLREQAACTDGCLRGEAFATICAIELDHMTPVLAYSIKPAANVRVRSERLEALGLEPGPWLTVLKNKLLARQLDAPIALPTGEVCNAAALGSEICIVEAPKRLVYATDLADTQTNRERLNAFAAGAHTLFLEATFRIGDFVQAQRTGHLTTRACGEIALAAGVEQLIPFHFSRRYEADVAAVYAEVAEVFENTVLPTGLRNSAQ